MCFTCKSSVSPICKLLQTNRHQPARVPCISTEFLSKNIKHQLSIHYRHGNLLSVVLSFFRPYLQICQSCQPIAVAKYFKPKTDHKKSKYQCVSHNEYRKQVKTATVKLLQHSKMPMYKRKSYASQLFLARLNNFVPYKRRN